MVTKKTNFLPMITERLLGRPLLLEPQKAQVIYDVLEGRLAPEIAVSIPDKVDGADETSPDASGFVGSYAREDGEFSFVRRSGGVAVIEVQGSLVNRGAWIGASSGLTSYEGIGAQIDEARIDGEISAVILDIDSPGGEATGMFTLAAKVRELSAVKPVIAVVNDVAASAAYGIASGATEIVVSPTSITGSIGVVMVHMDHSGQLKKKGVKPTIFQKGARKTDGHPYGPLSGDATAALNQMMSVLYDQFLETVEAGRGPKLSAEAARKTEAGIFVGRQAVEAGIADRIGNFDAVLAELQANARSGKPKEKAKMADNKSKPAATGDEKTYTQAEMDAAVTNAKADGAEAATARIGAILESDEGKANATLAAHFAFQTSQTAEDAIKALAVAGPAAIEPAATIPTPGQRAGIEPEMGSFETAPKAADSGWGEIVKDYNARM